MSPWPSYEEHIRRALLLASLPGYLSVCCSHDRVQGFLLPVQHQSAQNPLNSTVRAKSSVHELSNRSHTVQVIHTRNGKCVGFLWSQSTTHSDVFHLAQTHSAADVKYVCAADFRHIQSQRCVHFNGGFNKMARSLARCLPVWINWAQCGARLGWTNVHI